MLGCLHDSRIAPRGAEPSCDCGVGLHRAAYFIRHNSGTGGEAIVFFARSVFFGGVQRAEGPIRSRPVVQDGGSLAGNESSSVLSIISSEMALSGCVRRGFGFADAFDFAISTSVMLGRQRARCRRGRSSTRGAPLGRRRITFREPVDTRAYRFPGPRRARSGRGHR